MSDIRSLNNQQINAENLAKRNTFLCKKMRSTNILFF